MGKFKKVCKRCGKEIPICLPVTESCIDCLTKRSKKE